MPLSSWEQIEEYLQGRDPVSVAIGGAGQMRIEIAPRIPSVRFIVAAKDPESQDMPVLSQVEVTRSADSLELRVTQASLFETFHQLISEISRRIDVDPSDPIGSVRTTMLEWRALLEQKAGMSREQAIGLAGELWVLEALLRARGPGAIGSWTGALKESHDFRLQEIELEVKTTTAQGRVHVIHGIQQLTASPGATLFLLSLRMGSSGAGSGQTLSERVSAVRALLAGESRDEFDRRLGLVVPDESVLSRVPEQMKLLDEPRLIDTSTLAKIDERCLSEIQGNGSIDDVRYRLNVQGLGAEPSAPLFQQNLPFLLEALQ